MPFWLRRRCTIVLHVWKLQIVLRKSSKAVLWRCSTPIRFWMKDSYRYVEHERLSLSLSLADVDIFLHFTISSIQFIRQCFVIGIVETFPSPLLPCRLGQQQHSTHLQFNGKFKLKHQTEVAHVGIFLLLARTSSIPRTSFYSSNFMKNLRCQCCCIHSANTAAVWHTLHASMWVYSCRCGWISSTLVANVNGCFSPLAVQRAIKKE